MSYFQKTDHDPKTKNLISRIESVSVMVTNTETEALLLENTLIKKHQPHYNIDLKDAKRFAYIESNPGTVTPDQHGPARTGGARQCTFGPFVSAMARDEILQFVKRIFALPALPETPRNVPASGPAWARAAAPVSGR